jgi:predicted NBD/HSP70 family sugar kinase
MTAPSPAGQHTVRQHNSALVLDTIAAAPGVSRADIAARTGLTKATVSALVDRLIGADLVLDSGPQRKPGPGRRASALSLSPTGPHGLGVEIGVDYVATCLVDLTGEVRAQRVREADNRGPAGRVLAGVTRTVRAALRAAREEGVRVGGLGVAVPGLVDSTAGMLRVAPNLGWRDVDVAGALRQRPDLDGLPIEIGNEASFAALAELWTGEHGNLRDFVYVSGGVGIGGAIVVGGRLFDGVRGLGGELGHFCVDPNGPTCACGSRGCLEVLAGWDAIRRGAGAAGGERGQDPLDDLVRRLAEGEPAASGTVREAGRWLGHALANVVNLLDVPAVVLGGSYARLHPWLREPLLEQLRERVLAASWAEIDLRASTLGTRAPVRGAAASAVRAVLAEPDTLTG